VPEAEGFAEKLKDALEAGHQAAAAVLRPLLADQNPHDIASILHEFDDEEKVLIFEALGGEQSPTVLDETDEGSRKDILERVSPERIARLLELMPPDEAADLLKDIPADTRPQVLKQVRPADAEQLRKLSAYAPHTAGGIMTTEFAVVREDRTAADAIRKIQGAVDAETFDTIYVVDTQGVLVGRVSIRKIISVAPQTRIKDIMDDLVLSVTTDQDQEEVASTAHKYELTSVPVVSEEGVLQGIVTVDDVLDVVEEEVSEDMYRLAGTTGLHPSREAIPRRVLHRFPWLLITLFGGTMLALVLGAYSNLLEEMAAIVFFMPMIAGLSGNVGIQSSTIIVRGIATGEVDVNRTARVMVTELATGAIVGLICGSLAGLIALVLHVSPGRLFICVAASMFCSVSVAALMGTLIPLLCHRVGVDPAVSAGPFLTMLTDITSYAIYLTIASALLGLS